MSKGRGSSPFGMMKDDGRYFLRKRDTAGPGRLIGQRGDEDEQYDAEDSDGERPTPSKGLVSTTQFSKKSKSKALSCKSVSKKSSHKSSIASLSVHIQTKGLDLDLRKQMRLLDVEEDEMKLRLEEMQCKIEGRHEVIKVLEVFVQNNAEHICPDTMRRKNEDLDEAQKELRDLVRDQKMLQLRVQTRLKQLERERELLLDQTEFEKEKIQEENEQDLGSDEETINKPLIYVENDHQTSDQFVADASAKLEAQRKRDADEAAAATKIKLQDAENLRKLKLEEDRKLLERQNTLKDEADTREREALQLQLEVSKEKAAETNRLQAEMKIQKDKDLKEQREIEEKLKQLTKPEPVSTPASIGRFAEPEVSSTGAEQFVAAMVAAMGKLVPTSTSSADNSKFLARQSTSKELPFFSGKAEDWPVFFADFERTTADCSFTNSENMTRLRRCLKDPAAEYVKSLFVSPENVPIIIQKLKQRYGQPEHIIRDMIEKARRVKTVSADNMESIIEFEAAVTNFTATVKTLLRPEYLSNPQLQHELECKMSDSLRREWIGWVKQDSTRNRGLETFSEWLSTQASVACEISAPVFKELKPSSFETAETGSILKKRTSFNTRTVRDNFDIPTAAGLFAGTKTSCLFCEGMHDTVGCVKAQKMTMDERSERIKAARACFGCLKVGHITNNCQAYLRCIICGGRHQVIMCRNIVPQDSLATTHPESSWRVDQSSQNGPRPQQTDRRFQYQDPDWKPLPLERKDRVNHAVGRRDVPQHLPNDARRSPQQPSTENTNQKSIPQNTTTVQSKSNSRIGPPPKDLTQMSRQTVDGGVLLGTLLVEMVMDGRSRTARLVFDSGNQQSAIVTKTAQEMKFPVVGEDWRRSTLFGGVVTKPKKHLKYDVCLQSLGGTAQHHLILTDEPMICQPLPRVPCGEWTDEFGKQNIRFFDIVSESEDIEILIGNDYYQQLKTRRLPVTLKCGLTAEETIFGWTLNGKVPSQRYVNHEVRDDYRMMKMSMFGTSESIQELWELDTLGIRDPAESKTKQNQDVDARNHFAETVTRDTEGRYLVRLPWSHGVQKIPNNYEIAEKRLLSATNKLRKAGKYQDYDKIFNDWEQEGIIEVCDPEEKPEACHYLPHRPVFKPESLTTPVRPVFDASCKSGRNPSLNDCLEKGPNLMELIPSILMRFREKRIGIVSDIRKAFQMITTQEDDRNFLRFLWWEDPDQNQLRIYRHKRVVFGVNCSPFLLAAVLEHHLKDTGSSEVTSHDPENSLEERRKALQLLRSLYVDNCLTSTDTLEECLQFKEWAVNKLSEAKMELRQWEGGSSEESEIGPFVSKGCGLDFGRIGEPDQEKEVTSILGYKWDKPADTIYCDVPEIPKADSFTKRILLSSVQKFFDPLGFLIPAMIQTKILLQDAWKTKKGWDEELPEEIRSSFYEWMSEVSELKKISIPRHMSCGTSLKRRQEYHVFCDASKKAYAAVIFLRTVVDGQVTVRFLQARARVAPLKETITIPRMELLSCTIGARLVNSIIQSLKTEVNNDVEQDMEAVEYYLWTDSTTALAWIQRNDDWGTFVGNRVKEICTLTNAANWRHVPGIQNPADLPSRGCSPKQLQKSKWNEGPDWLKLEKEAWPTTEKLVDEDAVALEKKKGTVVKMLTKIHKVSEYTWYMPFSTYKKNWRFVGWMLRLKRNLQKAILKGKAVICENTHTQDSRVVDNLTYDELEQAEKYMWRMVQEEVFSPTDDMIAGIGVERDDMQLIRVKTRILNREDTEDFKKPLLLPSHHPLVNQLIVQEHRITCHAGTQLLSGILRERFWILQARRTINSAIYKCIGCIRFKSQKPNTYPSQLPGDRVGSAKVFEIIGVDLAGPLYANGEKVWIVIFTCAVFRCLNLELVSSLSTEAFLEAFTRHCARRGRPTTVYSDNGTNFVGTNNIFKSLDWKQIEETANIHRIRWKFNPPSAAWWGGWWERFVRTVKELLRRTLGKTKLSHEKLSTLLCEIEGVINRRPLTTVTDNPDDLRPLTPAMFLNETPCPDGNEFMDASGFQKVYKERKSLLEALKMRFRKEYLSMLVQREKEKKIRKFEVGDIVLVASDNKKRWEWPLARIIELLPGKDGHVRAARIQTATMITERPIPRLYPMEVSSNEDRPQMPVEDEFERIADVTEESPEEEMNPDSASAITTRSGRIVKKPVRLGVK